MSRYLKVDDALLALPEPGAATFSIHCKGISAFRGTLEEWAEEDRFMFRPGGSGSSGWVVVVDEATGLEVATLHCSDLLAAETPVDMTARTVAELQHVLAESGAREATYWNGEPARARRGTAVVAPAPAFPEYWARDLIGSRVDVVELVYGEDVRYLFNREGAAWQKVTERYGASRFDHAEVEVEPGSFEVSS